MQMRMWVARRVLTVGPVASQPGDVLCCAKREKKMTFYAHVHAMHVQSVRYGVLQPARVDATAGDMRTGNQMKCS
jgi:hypothetical protein